MLEMLRKFRALNYDYHNIGWYQSSYLGGHVDKNFLESQLTYQSALEESIVLAYGESAPDVMLLKLDVHGLCAFWIVRIRQE